MTPEHWKRLKGVLESALARPPAERDAFLASACGSDASLREEVETLIRSDEEAGSFLDLLDGTCSRPGAEAEETSPAAAFEGTDRFHLRHRLGSGAFGVVFEADDLERGTTVALKALHRSDPRALYRFKQEFRTLADVEHPNLVRLFELLSDGGQWFFTMELVRGGHMIEYVRGPRASGPGRPRAPGGAAEARLRRSLAQLVRGVSALHHIGKLHQDIKPSNVLVTPEGRLVLLDFGLVRELAPAAAGEMAEVGGTPAYMAPEQATGAPASEASDWYSVGVMLYELLTGTVPFTGLPLRILMDKQQRTPPPPAAVAEGVPEDLDRLCMELLRRDPTARPSESQVVSRLAPSSLDSARLSPPAFHRLTTVLVGRQRELDRLGDAFARVREGRTVMVRVRGRSGMGKSALLRGFFADLLRREPETLVLEGRCYQQESVPYKALDGLVDALSQHLGSLPRSEAEALLPEDVSALACVFPVLRQLAAVAGEGGGAAPAVDPLEARRRASAALREIFAMIGRRRPLVLAVDDLQWGDLDSSRLLSDLLGPPDPPPLLFVAAFRSEDVEVSPFLRMLLAGDDATPETFDLELTELTPLEAHDLAQALLSHEPEAADRIDAIARESGGSPFFLGELAQHVSARLSLNAPSVAAEAGDTVDAVVHVRISSLDGPARRLLETVAIAGQPIALATAVRAAELQAEQPSALAALRSLHLLRVRETTARPELETYHDRIRETVVARMPRDDAREHHRRLAAALEAAGDADPETLVAHFRGAGDLPRTGHYARIAAERAARALAFDRAADLYSLALSVDAEPDRRVLHEHLGDALSNAGRGAEAAPAYLAAAGAGDDAEALELRRRAAEQLLRSGRIDEGVDVLRRVLSVLGLRVPRTVRGAIVALVLRRSYIRLRGLGFRERAAGTIPARDLVRVDACWSAAMGLGLVDHIRGAEFQTRHLLLSLKAGEPYRVARALALETAYSAAGGGRAHAARLGSAALAQATRAAHPHAIALATLCIGLARHIEGRWREGRGLLTEADAILRERCTGVAWELGTTAIHVLICLLFEGEWKRLAAEVPARVKEARERGDQYLVTNLPLRIGYIASLAAGRPEEAQRDIDEGMRVWSERGFLLQHYMELVARVQIALYRKQEMEAWRLVTSRWAALQRSHLPRIPLILIESHHLRARAALGAAARAYEEGEPRRVAELLAVAEQDAQRIEREAMPWGDGLAALLRAGVAAARGHGDGAVGLLRSAQRALMTADMALYAAAAHRRQGEMLGGAPGRTLVEAADSVMSAQGIASPERIAAVLAPGRWAPR